jgi:hypothetical protein
MRDWIIRFPKYTPDLDPAGVQNPPANRQTLPSTATGRTTGGNDGKTVA